ncbi:hypothetical protein ABZP36_029095 [Zizania latifolia]
MEDKLLLLALAAAVLFVLSKLTSFASKPRLNLPPGPWTLPVIGSIHHLIRSHSSIHQSMRTLAGKHGPFMQIWLGEVPAVVVSSPEVAQEVLRNQDVTFADRFVNTTIGMIFANDLAFCPYGEQWRQLRLLCTQGLLTVARVKSFQRIRESEVASLVRDMATSAATGGDAVNLTERIGQLVNDIVLRCSVGGQSKHRDEYLDALHTALSQVTWLTVADIFPSSKLARLLGTAPRKAVTCRKKIECILKQIIQGRKEIVDRGTSNCDETARNECFLDILLRLQKEGKTPIPITNEVIIMLLFDMFSGGSGTSSSILDWTMAELIRSPRVMTKACDEVRRACQGKNTILEDDVIRLNYLKMVIKESLRLHCPLPLLAPRKCRETCKVMGYDVPKDTTVFVNAWAICRDPKYWVDAEEFKPERFEDMSIDLKGNNFEFLPFGSGRRMCPGMSLGQANIELPLASLLYHFDWKLPNEMEPKDVDMLEAPGLVGPKRTHLHLHPVVRIAPSIA